MMEKIKALLSDQYLVYWVEVLVIAAVLNFLGYISYSLNLFRKN